MHRPSSSLDQALAALGGTLTHLQRWLGVNRLRLVPVPVPVRVRVEPPRTRR